MALSTARLFHTFVTPSITFFLLLAATVSISTASDKAISSPWYELDEIEVGFAADECEESKMSLLQTSMKLSREPFKASRTWEQRHKPNDRNAQMAGLLQDPTEAQQELEEQQEMVEMPIEKATLVEMRNATENVHVSGTRSNQDEVPAPGRSTLEDRAKPLEQRNASSRHGLVLLLMSPRAEAQLVEALPAIALVSVIVIIALFLVYRLCWAALVDRKETTESPPRPTLSARPSGPTSWPSASRERLSMGPLVPGSLQSLASTSHVQPKLKKAPVEPQVSPLCAALVMPHSKADFFFKAESLQNLIAGRSPEPLLGPSGAHLLHARLQLAKSTSDYLLGSWLEISSSSSALFPHAGVGPIQLGYVASSRLEIHGSAGKTYGHLEHSGSGWRVISKGGIVLFSIDPASWGQALACIEVSGSLFASATPSDDRSKMHLQVLPGSDVVLAILSMLAVFLMSPELARLR